MSPERSHYLTNMQLKAADKLSLSIPPFNTIIIPVFEAPTPLLPYPNSLYFEFYLQVQAQLIAMSYYFFQ